MASAFFQKLRELTIVPVLLEEFKGDNRKKRRSVEADARKDGHGDANQEAKNAQQKRRAARKTSAESRKHNR